MKIQSILKLSGPNIWANFSCLEVWLDLEELEQTNSAKIPGFNERLMRWLPSMIEHRCSIGERGGFFERLRDGTWMGHILEHVALELQTLAGTTVGFGRTRETSKSGVYKVAIEYVDEQLGLACLDAGFRLCTAAIEGQEFDVEGEIKKLQDVAYNNRLGPSTGAIVEAARARHIPTYRLNSESLVQLGHGSQQRRINAAETDRTGAVAEAIAQDKQLTRELLQAIGVSVPQGRSVNDAEDAWAAARELGTPVVVKPRGGNHGRGVAINLKEKDQILAAYETAAVEGGWVMVEQYITGDDYRLLVVGGRLVAAARRTPAHVIGDGVSSIRELVDEVNRDPLRADGHATALSKLRLDAIALAVLAEQGFTPDSIPEAKAYVPIRGNGNLSTGGTATDVTDEVHPEVARNAVDAVRMVGLDVAGIDVIAQDISRPLAEQGGAILEINAQPGLRMHVYPSYGTPRAVGKAIVDMMIPEGHTARVPIVAVTGVNGKTTVTRLISHILSLAGRRVGMTCTDGVYIDGRRIDGDDCSGPRSARNVLMNPIVDAAVLETARGGILRCGLGFDFCDIGVVTNIGEGDHLGLSDVNTLEQLAKVKRTVIEAVAKTGAGVLNADDPLVSDMASKCPGEVVFFTRDPQRACVVERRQRGGRVAFDRDGAVVLAKGDAEITLLSLERIPLTHGGRTGFQIENVLAAAAACWALGIPCEQIQLGLQSFSAHMDGSPGRFNIMSAAGATMIVDYGHNASSLAAVLKAIESFPHQIRTAVYTTAGDRRDDDIIRQGEQLAAAFDRVIVYEDHYLRGRGKGEIIRLLKQGLATGKRVTDVRESHSWTSAADEALRVVKPGELLLVQADQIEETVQYLKRMVEVGVVKIREPEPTAPHMAMETAAVPEPLTVLSR